jgi:hypothetical protein
MTSPRGVRRAFDNVSRLDAMGNVVSVTGSSARPGYLEHVALTPARGGIGVVYGRPPSDPDIAQAPGCPTPTTPPPPDKDPPARSVTMRSDVSES